MNTIYQNYEIGCLITQLFFHFLIVRYYQNHIYHKIAQQLLLDFLQVVFLHLYLNLNVILYKLLIIRIITIWNSVSYKFRKENRQDIIDLGTLNSKFILTKIILSFNYFILLNYKRLINWFKIQSDKDTFKVIKIHLKR